jgi:hypothetical protein
VKRRQFQTFIFSRELNEMKILLEKGDTKEQIMMAEAMLANKMVSAIETVTYSCQKVQKSDDEVAKAVIVAAGFFGVGSQWTAIYRVLVDFCGWESDIAAFYHRMNTLLNNVAMHHPCNYQAIQKTLSANLILRKNFLEWRKYKVPEGDRVFPRQMFIAEKLLKLLSINA